MPVKHNQPWLHVCRFLFQTYKERESSSNHLLSSHNGYQGIGIIALPQCYCHLNLDHLILCDHYRVNP